MNERSAEVEILGITRGGLVDDRDLVFGTIPKTVHIPPGADFRWRFDLRYGGEDFPAGSVLVGGMSIFALGPDGTTSEVRPGRGKLLSGLVTDDNSGQSPQTIVLTFDSSYWPETDALTYSYSVQFTSKNGAVLGTATWDPSMVIEPRGGLDDGRRTSWRRLLHWLCWWKRQPASNA